MSPSPTNAARVVMDEGAVADALRRIAAEIVARAPAAPGPVLVAVRRGGIPLAARLRALLGQDVPVGSVDITLYRDDAATALPNPQIGRSEIPFDVDGRRVVLVDDVLFTGRTTRAAIDAVMDYGRPRAIELAVLVDRGHRELPIQADYVGLRLATAADERVDVVADGEDANATVRVEVRGARIIEEPS